MRVQIKNAFVDPTTGKFAVSFILRMGDPGSEYEVGDVASAAVFDTEDEAYVAGDFALDYFKVNGKFPNMCEKF